MDSMPIDDAISNEQLFPHVPHARTALAEFETLVQSVFDDVAGCLLDNGQLDSVLAKVATPVYVKDENWRILYSNPAYIQFFATDLVPIGCAGETFLDESIIHVSQASDQLISKGADRLFFEHVGTHSDGRTYLMRTAKRALTSKENPGISILGVTEIVKLISVESDKLSQRRLLAQQWDKFRLLDERDRDIAVAIAQGHGSAEIAEQHDITKRTVENRRKHLLRHMKLESQLGLVKLIVRFEENGFAEFHV
jgi:DNA-binding NarL/FixJ family response regulator